MLHRRNRRRRTDEGVSLVRVVTACAAYSLALTIGVLAFGLPPSGETPPAQHPHGVHPTQAPLEVGVAPHARQRCVSARPCGHERNGRDHQPGHDVHKRLSPRQLSLAKW